MENPRPAAVPQPPIQDDEERPARVEDAPALCLSGGGYRAMLFHVGALWRLNLACYLPRLRRISSVSGGSITAGRLGLVWSQLGFDTNGFAQRFDDEVVQPLRHMAAQSIDLGAIAGGVLPWRSPGASIADAYDKHLFHGATLQDLPADDAGPRFVINATNVQTGRLFRFSRPYLGDYTIGRMFEPRFPLALAVAGSSAFPPVLSPLIVDFQDGDLKADAGTTLNEPPYTTRVFLTDGGVYDNLGLETVWKRYGTVLVSDGGGRMAPEPAPNRDWLRHTKRVLDSVDNQVRSLRKRDLLASYTAPPESSTYRRGTYWGIRTNVADYHLADSLPCPFDQTTRLAETPTRLTAMNGMVQERLINWGFAVCDAALRRHLDPSLSRPNGFPYPDSGLG